MIALCLQQTQAERAFGYLERIRSLALRQYFSKAKTSSDERVEQGGSVFPSALQKNETTLLRTQYDLRNWQERYRQYSVLLTEIDPSVSPSIDREVLQNELKACEAKISELFERLHLHQSATSLTSPISKHARRHTQCLDTAQLQEQLLPDQLLLAYFLYKGKLVIFAITKKHVITHEHPNGLAQLERLLPLLHAHLDPAGWPDLHKPPQQSIQRLLHKLYDLLVAPMEALLPLSPAYLTIVPYGPLHNLPFHALYNGSRFLIEDFQINYLPASSMLLHLKTCQIEQDVRRRERDALTQPPIVLGYSDNGHLRRIIDEAKTVAALLDGKCYLEEEATIARLAQVAPGSPIIHLATHGQRRLDAPNFSYVRLADGQLNALDAFTLNLQGCRLVTLSGCETGLALIGGGDEQLGLGRAFLAAGARSVVMSLWSVEDHATNELMQHFYQRLLSGDSRVQALRAAQCHLLQGTSPPCTHPYFWAAFRLVGEMGVLQFGREKEPLLNNRSSAPKEQPPGLLACL